MAMTTRMMIYAFLLYGGIFAAIVAVIARVIKYLIRYGIDYYFEKLKETQKASPSGTISPGRGKMAKPKGGALPPQATDEGKPWLDAALTKQNLKITSPHPARKLATFPRGGRLRRKGLKHDFWYYGRNAR